MFGYIKASKGELKVKEYEMYKAVYCSLCRTLGKEYGFFTRFTLSYDFTFLALLQLSLNEKSGTLCRKACVCNPLKRCNYLLSDKGYSLSSAAAVILLYYKLCDDISDEKGIKKLLSKFLKLFFKGAYKKAVKNYPQINTFAKEFITEQAKAEKQENTTLDICALPTQQLLGNIFSLCAKNEAEKRTLSYLGSLMGRYIYLMDAACDCEEDAKKGRFNPLGKLSKQQVIERITPQIYIIIDQAIKAFNLIEFKRYKDILGNIIYVGLEDTMKKELLK